MDFNNELLIHGFLGERYHFVTVVEVVHASIPEAITSEKGSKASSAQSRLVTDVQSTALVRNESAFCKDVTGLGVFGAQNEKYGIMICNAMIYHTCNVFSGNVGDDMIY